LCYNPSPQILLLLLYLFSTCINFEDLDSMNLCYRDVKHLHGKKVMPLSYYFYIIWYNANHWFNNFFIWCDDTRLEEGAIYKVVFLDIYILLSTSLWSRGSMWSIHVGMWKSFHFILMILILTKQLCIIFDWILLIFLMTR